MSEVFRYDQVARITSPLNPLSDVVSWIRGLRSTSYVGDLLAQHHGFSSTRSIQVASRTIATHAETAMGLLEQGLGSSPELAYLPIYYALLNLAKIIVIAGGRLSDLRRQRFHGARWSGITTASHDLLTDHITLMGLGAIPLFYQTLTGSMWPNARQKARGRWTSSPKRQIRLRHIYPYISFVGHEYSQIYGVSRALASIQVRFEETSANRGRIRISFLDEHTPTRLGRNRFKLLTGLTQDRNSYVTRIATGVSAEEVSANAAHQLRRFLLYSHVSTTTVSMGIAARTAVKVEVTETPISSSHLLLPEEMPILLAFFHLGNVVRYDPERLQRLRDSCALALIECLIHHGTYRYLLLFWSYMNKTVFFIHG
jgi:hypothetical protein